MFDLLIIGGGLVGAGLACALRDSGLRIAVLESAAILQASPQRPHYDDRVLALSYGSRQILGGLGLWAAIAPQATAIKKIHVSDRGHFGKARMDAAQLGKEALGYVAEAKILGQVFHDALRELPNVEVFAPAQLTALHQFAHRVEVEFLHKGQPQRLSAKLLAAADGGDSWTRQRLAIATRRRDYQQTAIIANLTPAKPHQHWAFERFTDTGPLALLPMREQRCSLVWTVRPTQVETLMQLSDAAFLRALQERFGWHLGRFEQIGQRSAFPLRLTEARAATSKRVAILGNAAHTLHPVAGQGLNLGLRDLAALAQLLLDATAQGRNIGDTRLLRDYAAWREPDQRRTIDLTDGLARLFVNEQPWLIAGRNLGLCVMDRLPPLKRLLMRQTAGMRGEQSRFARGG